MKLDAFILLADMIVGFDSDIAYNALSVTSIYSINVRIEEIKSICVKIKSEYNTYIRDRESEAIETMGHIPRHVRGCVQ